MLKLGYEPTDLDCYSGYSDANDEVFNYLMEIGLPFDKEWEEEQAIDYMPENQVEIIISKGAKPTEFTYDLIVEWRNYDLLKLILKEKVDNEALGMMLKEAIVIGDIESLRILMETGFDVNQTIETEDGKTTLLHIASENPSRHIVEYLLDLGAEPDKLDEEGQTPYDRAKECNFLEIAEMVKI